MESKQMISFQCNDEPLIKGRLSLNKDGSYHVNNITLHEGDIVWATNDCGNVIECSFHLALGNPYTSIGIELYLGQEIMVECCPANPTTCPENWINHKK